MSTVTSKSDLKAGERGSPARRAALVEAAAALFAERGYERTTVKDIVTAAKVAQGTFYLYFPSKEAALRAVAEALVERVTRTASEASLGAGSPLERILLASRVAFESFARERQLLLAAVHASGTEAHHRVMALEILPKFERPLEGWIREAIARGEIPPDVEPSFAASFIVSAGTRILIDSLLFGHPAPPDEVVPHLVTFLRRALAGR